MTTRYIEKIVFEITHFRDGELRADDLQKMDRVLNETFDGMYFVCYKQDVTYEEV